MLSGRRPFPCVERSRRVRISCSTSAPEFSQHLQRLQRENCCPDGVGSAPRSPPVAIAGDDAAAASDQLLRCRTSKRNLSGRALEAIRCSIRRRPMAMAARPMHDGRATKPVSEAASPTPTGAGVGQRRRQRRRRYDRRKLSPRRRQRQVGCRVGAIAKASISTLCKRRMRRCEHLLAQVGGSSADWRRDRRTAGRADRRGGLSARRRPKSRSDWAYRWRWSSVLAGCNVSTRRGGGRDLAECIAIRRAGRPLRPAMATMIAHLDLVAKGALPN